MLIKLFWIVLLLIVILSVILGVVMILIDEDESRRITENYERRKEEKERSFRQDVEGIYYKMKQDSRFQRFFKDLQIVLIRYKNEIEYVKVYNNCELCIYLKTGQWDIEKEPVRIEFSDYQFKLSEVLDSAAVLYGIVQEVSFMVYRINSRDGIEYESKDIVKARYYCYYGGEEWSAIGIIFAKNGIVHRKVYQYY